MDRGSVDIDAFLQVVSLQCVRTENAPAVAQALDLPHFQPAKLPDDLLDVDPHELPCLIAAAGGWTYVFGHARGLRGGRALSSEFGECLSLHIDVRSGTYRCERAEGGTVHRRIYASEADHEYVVEGDPGPGEPLLAGGSLTAGEVLAFAAAWGSDPLVVLRGHVTRSFIASRKAQAAHPPRPKASAWATAGSALALVAVVAGASAALWWVIGPGQGTATEICERQALCSGCVGCVAAPPHPCAEAFAACEADPACFELTECLARCQDLTSRAGLTAPDDRASPCFATCRADHADGLSAYCTWTECAHRGTCADQCADPGYQELAACG